MRTKFSRSPSPDRAAHADDPTRAVPAPLACLMLLALGACGSPTEESSSPVPPVVHLLSDLRSWEVSAPRQPVLSQDAHDKLTELLARDGAPETPDQAVWVTEEISPGHWRPRAEFAQKHQGVELWVYRPKHRIALPTAALEHAEFEAELLGDAALDSPFEFTARDRTVSLVLPAGASRDGFRLVYPTLPGEKLSHLGDFAKQPNEMPALRDVTIGVDTRRCVLLPPPLAIETTLTVPPNGRLHFAFGVAPIGLQMAGNLLLEGPSSSDGMGFRLTVTPPGGSPQVVWEEFAAAAGSHQFQDASASLQPWEGQEIALEFSSFGSPASATSSSTLHDLGFLAEPVLTRGDAAGRAPNVLIVLIDTLRAGVLGCYGGKDAATPVLDRLATDGVLFSHARSSSSWTLPSHVSLFCSAFPTQHGALRMTSAMPPHLTTVAEVARAAGWRTLAVADGAILSPTFGLSRGFDVFDSTNQGVANRAARMLEVLDAGDGPFFGFLHTYEVHDPYDPPPEFRERYVKNYRGSLPSRVGQWNLEKLRNASGGAAPSQRDIDYVRSLYHAEVAYTDRVLGDFFDQLRSRGLWENTLIIVTSDHGEEFWEHGDIRHGRTLYEEQLRVPMILHHPEKFRGGQRFDNPVRIEDVAPTIAEFLGIPAPEAWVGIPLSKPRERRDILAAITPWDEVRQSHSPVHATLHAHHKWIQTEPGTYRGAQEVGSQLFHLESDPGEQNPLDDQAMQIDCATILDALMTMYRSDSQHQRETALSAETIEQLKALGYLK